jgi:hypothetical protein
MPMGFLFVPAIDATVSRSLRCALTVTNALAFGVAATMLVPSLPVQARVDRALFFPSFFHLVSRGWRSHRRTATAARAGAAEARADVPAPASATTISAGHPCCALISLRAVRRP